MIVNGDDIINHRGRGYGTYSINTHMKKVKNIIRTHDGKKL